MIADPGLIPRSPVTTVEPVLVTAEAPRTAKFFAVPSAGGACAMAALKGAAVSSATNNRTVSRADILFNVSVATVRIFTIYLLLRSVRARVALLTTPSRSALSNLQQTAGRRVGVAFLHKIVGNRYSGLINIAQDAELIFRLLVADGKWFILTNPEWVRPRAKAS